MRMEHSTAYSSIRFCISRAECAGSPVGFGQAGFNHAGGAVGHAFSGIEARGGGGDFALDQAELGDRLAEGVALFGIADHLCERVPSAADAGDAQLEAAHVETLKAMWWPLPASPRRFSAGTLQS